MFVRAVLAWRLVVDSSGLAAGIGVLEFDTNVIVSTQGFPGGNELISLAFWADEVVEKVLGVIDIDINALTMIPVLATTLTCDHHAMIIWTTAEAVFSPIVAFIVGRETTLGTRSLAGTICKTKS